MNPRRRFPLLSVAIVTLGASALGACGSDDPAAVTVEVPSEVDDTSAAATDPAVTDPAGADSTVPAPDASAPGDGTIVDTDFCRAAAKAEALGDEVDGAQNAGPAELEAVVTAAFDAGSDALALAPADIADVLTRNVAFQERFIAILEQYEWDPSAAFTSAEGKTFVAEAEAAEADLDLVRSYLEDNCGIVDDSAEPDADVPGTPDLPDGDAGLQRFIELYAVGAQVDLTEEQIDCFVQELSGTVEVEQLEALLGGAEDNEAEVAVGLAGLACDIINA